MTYTLYTIYTVSGKKCNLIFDCNSRVAIGRFLVERSNFIAINVLRLLPWYVVCQSSSVVVCDAELKQQISQKTMLLRHHIAEKSLCCKSNIIFCDICCFSSASRPYKTFFVRHKLYISTYPRFYASVDKHTRQITLYNNVWPPVVIIRHKSIWLRCAINKQHTMSCRSISRQFPKLAARHISIVQFLTCSVYCQSEVLSCTFQRHTLTTSTSITHWRSYTQQKRVQCVPGDLRLYIVSDVL